MKLLIALVPLLAICSGQTNLPNSVDLSDKFRLNWEILSTAGDIVLEIEAETIGWVSLSITDNTRDGYLGDLFWVGYDNTTLVSYSSVCCQIVC